MFLFHGISPPILQPIIFRSYRPVIRFSSLISFSRLRFNFGKFDPFDFGLGPSIGLFIPPFAVVYVEGRKPVSLRLIPHSWRAFVTVVGFSLISIVSFYLRVHRVIRDSGEAALRESILNDISLPLRFSFFVVFLFFS